MTWGVDYASVDGNHQPNLSAFTAAGGSFVWLRSSYAAYDRGHGAWRIVPDPVLARDWQALADAGLVRGAYMGPAILASHAPEEQVGVAKAALDAAGGLRPGEDFPFCLDVEFPQGIRGTGLTRDGVVAWLRRAVAEVRRVFGHWPIIYTSARVWDDDDADCLGSPKAPDLVQCPLWLARYLYPTRRPAVLPPPLSPPPVPTPWQGSYWAHQNQGDALGVPGFSATTDIDRFNSYDCGVFAAPADPRCGWVEGRLVAAHAFGFTFAERVRAFQSSCGLSADAVIGPRTFSALAAISPE